MRVLLDECVDRHLAEDIQGHEVSPEEREQARRILEDIGYKVR